MIFSKSAYFSMLIAAAMTSFAFASPEKITNPEKIADPGRIVGGEEAELGEYPYFVEMGGCGGALVAPDIVLTAAHCGDYKGQQLIIGGYSAGELKEGSQMRFCDEWMMDPKYNGGTYNYDFALCKLNKPVIIDSNVKLELNKAGGVPKEEEDLVVMGLGTTSFGGGSVQVLRDVTVPAISNEQCNDISYYGGEITNVMLCAGFQEGGKDSCQGDSGGPLIRRKNNNDGTITDTHVGVVSWGEGCAFANKPGVYARTSANIEWIKETSCSMGSIADFCDDGSAVTCDQDLTLTLTTDRWGKETSWTLSDSEYEEVMSKSYLLNNYKNEQKLCVKSNECYEFTVRDSYGDGMCDEGECGSYSIDLNGEEIHSETNPDFGFSRTVEFCTGAGVSPPTNCQDSESFEFNNYPKKTCKKWVGDGLKKEIKKKCKRDWLGYKVYKWCPETCGKVNLGSC
jgi:secreted trypsin-like serine protease